MELYTFFHLWCSNAIISNIPLAHYHFWLLSFSVDPWASLLCCGSSSPKLSWELKISSYYCVYDNHCLYTWLILTFIWRHRALILVDKLSPEALVDYGGTEHETLFDVSETIRKTSGPNIISNFYHRIWDSFYLSLEFFVTLNACKSFVGLGIIRWRALDGVWVHLAVKSFYLDTRKRNGSKLRIGSTEFMRSYFQAVDGVLSLHSINASVPDCQHDGKIRVTTIDQSIYHRRPQTVMYHLTLDAWAHDFG